MRVDVEASMVEIGRVKFPACGLVCLDAGEVWQ